MENQNYKIKQLFHEGILTKEEMDAELKKMGKTAVNTTNKRWWIAGVIVTVIGLTLTLVFTHCNSTPAEENVAKTAQWKITSIDGVKAIQTQFHNQNYGILQVTYSPSLGIRFGLFDNSMKQIALTSATAGFSRIVTKEEVDADYEKMKANGFADEEYYQKYLEEVGTLSSQLFAFPSYKDGFIYYTDGNAEKLISQIDNGTAKSLLLTQTVESMDESDFPEVIEYEWLTKFNPGDFSTLISKL